MKAGTSVVFLPCRDIQKTEAFYHGILGLEEEKQGGNVLIFDTGYGLWGFCAYMDSRPPLSGEKGVCLSLNLESAEAVDRVFEKLRDLVTVVQGPAHHPDFPVYSCFIADPDGYRVELQFTGERKDSPADRKVER